MISQKKEALSSSDEKQFITSFVDVYAHGEGTALEIGQRQNCTWIDLVGEKDVSVVLKSGRTDFS